MRARRLPSSRNITARQNWSTRPVRTRGSAELAIGSTCSPGVVSSAESFCRNAIACARTEPSSLTGHLVMMIVGITSSPSASAAGECGGDRVRRRARRRCQPAASRSSRSSSGMCGIATAICSVGQDEVDRDPVRSLGTDLRERQAAGSASAATRSRSTPGDARRSAAAHSAAAAVRQPSATAPERRVGAAARLVVVMTVGQSRSASAFDSRSHSRQASAWPASRTPSRSSSTSAAWTDRSRRLDGQRAARRTARPSPAGAAEPGRASPSSTERAASASGDAVGQRHCVAAAEQEHRDRPRDGRRRSSATVR